MTLPVLVGRSSSHFTRVARIFALELAIPHTFRPVFDMTSLDIANYEGSPALKVPTWLDEQGLLFGTENICRALVRRAGAEDVVLRGWVAENPARVASAETPSERLIANTEELTLHLMATEVTLIMAKVAGDARLVPPKVMHSVTNSLDYLDAHVDELTRALPERRRLSFVEVGLFSVVTHLPFREVLDVSPWKRLVAFCERFGERKSAQDTVYRFDRA